MTIKVLKIFIVVAVCIAIILIAPCLGAVRLPLFSLSPVEEKIFYSIRIPRVLLAFFTGGALAMCGVVYQALFRNPLASPYTLGISSGAALGASLASVIGSIHALPIYGIFGALITVSLISMLNRESRGDVSRLLLSGVMISFLFSSIILFLQYLGDFTAVVRISRWLMGSVETTGYSHLLLVSTASIAGLFSIIFFSTELSLIVLGSDLAATKGVAVESVVYKLFVITSMVIGIVVSVCGPIGFVGIAVPLCARSLGALHYRSQIFLSFLLGGTLLTLCDTFGRTIIAPAEIPVGVITALLGAPIIIGLLLRKKAVAVF